jgi:hypothetical protein
VLHQRDGRFGGSDAKSLEEKQRTEKRAALHERQKSIEHIGPVESSQNITKIPRKCTRSLGFHGGNPERPTV